MNSVNLAVVKRFLFLGAVYSFGVTLSLYLAYLIRFDFDLGINHLAEFPEHLGWILPVKLGCFLFFGLFQGLLSFFSIPDLRRLALACMTASTILLMVWVQSGGTAAPPRGVLLADFTISLMGIAAARLGLRMWRESQFSGQQGRRRAKRVGVLGAGYVGASLVKELLAKRHLGLHPVALFDDDLSKAGSSIHGVHVFGKPERLTESKLNLNLDEVIIAMPRASAKRLGECIRILQGLRLKFETVPAMDQLATGQLKVTQLREVQIDDLLGRDEVDLDLENIRAIVSGKVVMVTGGGGSIGSELCRQIARINPSRLLIVEQCEVQIFKIEQELIQLGYAGVVLPLVADILDRERMRGLFERFKPEVIFHAAAHKHVPMMESQPSEALKNNFFGTAALADLSIEYGVDRFVLISTDKAINPTNVMGSTKRMAEIYLQSVSASNKGKTKFMAVRFGNVLGSSGSVVPIFRRQILEGGPVKVTHKDVTRYFMTIPESVGLVLQSASQGEGGEIFVLDMGEPVKIVDLARQMIELSGYKPDEDIMIEFTGLRPGEKLFEELIHTDENHVETHHPKIMRFVSTPRSHQEVRAYMDLLKVELDRSEPETLKKRIKEFVPEYEPYLT